LKVIFCSSNYKKIKNTTRKSNDHVIPICWLDSALNIQKTWVFFSNFLLFFQQINKSKHFLIVGIFLTHFGSCFSLSYSMRKISNKTLKSRTEGESTWRKWWKKWSKKGK